MSKLQSPFPWFRPTHCYHQSPPQPHQIRMGRRMSRIQMTMTFHLFLNMFPLSTKPDPEKDTGHASAQPKPSQSLSKVLLGSVPNLSLGSVQILTNPLLHLNQRFHVKIRALMYHPVIQPCQEEGAEGVVVAGVAVAEVARGSTSRYPWRPPAPPPQPLCPRCPPARGREACGAKCADLARPRTAAPVTTVLTNRSLVAPTRRSKLALTVNV